MTAQRLRVHGICVSVDGYAAGPDQTETDPLGVGGQQLHEWIFATPFGKRMIGQDDAGAPPSVDNDLLERGFENIGAWILGRNMFGPVRGEWGHSEWKGWWGDEPPYHCDVFVLTHYPRDAIEMEGGTTFHFVTDGIEDALARAFVSAEGKDVRLGGGASAVQQYLAAGLVDEMHFAIVPVLLGRGESLFGDVDVTAAGYKVLERVESAAVTHVRIGKPI